MIQADARARPAALIAAAEDLLNHPRHTITPKDRKWLKGQLREARRTPTTREPMVAYEEAAVELGDVSDAYLAENNLSRDQWEAMVAKELGKLNPRQPSQRDLFA